MEEAEGEKSERESSTTTTTSWHVVILVTALIASVVIGAKYNQRDTGGGRVCNTTVHPSGPKYRMFSQYSNVEDRDGIMKHVHLVLNRLGLSQASNDSDWDLLWSHDFPFRLLYPQIRSLHPRQLVNHFPGTGYITNKVDFATTHSSFIPRAFKMPEDLDRFKAYSETSSDSLFVQKHNQHRGVVVKNVTEITSGIDEKSDVFIQEYVTRPFLVDGHKFDIGVYTILTSVDPLRVYIYKGDVLFRYCPSKYYPFDAQNLDKYVIGDDYLPTWEVPSLAPYYTAMGYGMKESFDAYARSKGKDPQKIWDQVDVFMEEIFNKKQHHIISALKNYRSSANFFEMMRFDFVVDEDLNLFALEANMSPNLSSAHFPPNQLLYEQVLYSIFSLVGVAKYTHSHSFADRSPAETSMKVSDKNIAVWSKECGSQKCIGTCDGTCGTCRHCISPSIRQIFTRTYLEQINKNDCRRVYPKPMVQGVKAGEIDTRNLSPNDALLKMWLQGKCNQDLSWCY